MHSIREVGDSWDMKSETLCNLEHFVCAVYGSSKVKSIDNLRLQLLNKKFDGGMTLACGKSFNLSSLPPCRDSLWQHLKRVNYQVLLLKYIFIQNIIIYLSNNTW